VVETDAPDQRPREAGGARGEVRPGRPTDLVRVIAAVADLRGLGPAEVGRATAQNACALFGA
jgi:Tat protein secretion system quality control protein TatD with DNase activity